MLKLFDMPLVVGLMSFEVEGLDEEEFSSLDKSAFSLVSGFFRLKKECRFPEAIYLTK